LRGIANHILDFFRTGIWMIPEKSLSRTKVFAFRTLKVFLLTVRGFREEQCPVKASALTFYSVLSVVPIVAMFFGIAKGFGFDKKLQAQLLAKFSGQEDVLLRVFEFSNRLLQKTKGGVVAGIGVVFLFWSVISVLGHIEYSFNDIWNVRKGRTFARKCSDYLSVMLVCPVIFLLASSLTVMMASQVKFVAERLDRLGLPSGPILLLLDILPFVLIWVLFTFVYIFLPNTKVRFLPGLIAGVVAGTAYQATQWIYIAFQVGVARTNAIYGSFAALPLFLIWMQVSWVIVLLGAVISFAVQNVDTLGFAADAEKVSPEKRRLLSLMIARLVVRNFAAGEKALSAPEIAARLGMPFPLVRRVLGDFAASGLFSVTSEEEYEEPAYQPAFDIHRITVKTVLDALDRCGSVELAFPATEEYRGISESLAAFESALEESPANKPLIDL
jgi:membrane protein